MQRRLFGIPAHPCLKKRRQKQQQEDEAAVTSSLTTAVSTSNSNPTSSSGNNNKSCLEVKNFVVDRTTLMVMLEVLNRSSDIDTLTFHNSGLNNASVRLLAEGLPHTAVRSFSLDYNLDGGSRPDFS